jgi:hypothetical protein
MKFLYKYLMWHSLMIIGYQQSLAQLKIGANPTSIRNASLLELESPNQGLVFPRVQLSSINSSNPLPADLLEGTTVYNTNNGLGMGTGLYVWKGANWQSVSSQSASNGLSLVGNDVRLGGSLTQHTTINKSGYNLYFTGNGNIGIGTTSANAPLVVNAANSHTGVLKLTVPSNNAGDQWWLGFNHGATSSDATDRARIGVTIANGGAGRLFFTTGTSGSQSERMRIDENGYVGIGTTSPTQMLDVNGNVRIRSFNTAGIVTTDANGNLNVGTVANGITMAGSTIKLGGTLTENTTLQLGNSGNVFAVTATNAGGGVAGVFGLQVKDGNVSIGSASPSFDYRLDIAKNDNNTSLLLRNGNGSNEHHSNQIAFGYNGTAQYMHAIKTRHNGGGLAGNAIDFFVWNQTSNQPGEIGNKKVLTIDGGGSGTTGTVEVNGNLKQSAYSQAVTVNGNGSHSFVWTHNLGYRPVLMISLDQTNGGFLDYCSVSIGHNSNNQITIYLTNRNISQATGTVRWIVVN